ncbi:DNA polymerase epsilon subunit 2, partial [Stegodyphus mimosarum]
MNSVKTSIVSAFNMHGYTLRSEALRFLQEKLEPLDDTQRHEEVQKVLDHVNTQNLSSPMIEKDIIENIIKSLETASSDDGILFKVYDAFSLHRYTYNTDSKKFLNWALLHDKSPSLHGSSDSKADIFIERYKMVHQRTARHKVFAAPVIRDSSRPSNSYSLKAVEHLLGTSGREKNVVVLGMLTQLKEGQFFLEDPTGAVRLNLKKA